jgi:hypothetical protein
VCYLRSLLISACIARVAGLADLAKVGFRDLSPHVVREVPDEELVDQVDGPEYVVDEHEDQGMVVIPADHQGVDAQDTVNNA